MVKFVCGQSDEALRELISACKAGARLEHDKRWADLSRAMRHKSPEVRPEIPSEQFRSLLDHLVAGRELDARQVLDQLPWELCDSLAYVFATLPWHALQRLEGRYHQEAIVRREPPKQLALF